jgi:hypothetical protein
MQSRIYNAEPVSDEGAAIPGYGGFPDSGDGKMERDQSDDRR